MAPLERGDWDNLLRCLQRVAREQADRGLVVVNLKVVIVRGVPKVWTRPEAQVFEPAGQGAELLAILESS